MDAPTDTGSPAGLPAPPPAPPGGRAGPRRLHRRPDDGPLAGVCAGVAEYFDIDPVIVRIAPATQPSLTRLAASGMDGADNAGALR